MDENKCNCITETDNQLLGELTAILQKYTDGLPAKEALDIFSRSFSMMLLMTSDCLIKNEYLNVKIEFVEMIADVAKDYLRQVDSARIKIDKKHEVH